MINKTRDNCMDVKTTDCLRRAGDSMRLAVSVVPVPAPAPTAALQLASAAATSCKAPILRHSWQCRCRAVACPPATAASEVPPGAAPCQPRQRWYCHEGLQRLGCSFGRPGLAAGRLA